MKRKSIVVLLVLLLVGILAFTAFACNNNKDNGDDDKKPPVEEKPGDETPNYLSEALPAIVSGADGLIKELAAIEDEAYISAGLEFGVIVGEGAEQFELSIALNLKASISENTTSKNWAFVEIAVGGEEGNNVALFAEAAGEMFPYKDKSTDGITGCPELSFLSPESLRAGAAWWEMFVGYAYLYVPRPMFGAENAFAALGWYFGNSALIPEPLRDPEERRISVANVGVINCGDEGFIQEFMVMDEKRMFRMLRILAPVLREYRARLVVVNADGVMSYDCDYDFVPVGGYIHD